jgi:hypothetical protein
MMARVSEFLVAYLASIDERLLDYLDEDDELRPEIDRPGLRTWRDHSPVEPTSIRPTSYARRSLHLKAAHDGSGQGLSGGHDTEHQGPFWSQFLTRFAGPMPGQLGNPQVTALH